MGHKYSEGERERVRSRQRAAGSSRQRAAGSSRTLELQSEKQQLEECHCIVPLAASSPSIFHAYFQSWKQTNQSIKNFVNKYKIIKKVVKKVQIAMPKVTAQGKTATCEVGANLRQVLLQNGIDLYNGQAKLINCRGIGSCGTCAVELEGEVSPANWKDKGRRSLPPHNPAKNRRLACQTKVLGDVRITKFDGFWGQGDQPLWTPEG